MSEEHVPLPGPDEIDLPALAEKYRHLLAPDDEVGLIPAAIGFDKCRHRQIAHHAAKTGPVENLFGVGQAGLGSDAIGSVIVQSLLFFGIIGLGSSIISLPFSIYGTFVIEERFGFNTTTPKIFIMDMLKSMLLYAFHKFFH